MATEEHAVSLKLPTFWTAQPEVWFAQTEAQLSLHRITADDTKYYYVLAALNPETATRVLDLINLPPNDNKYQALKTQCHRTGAPPGYFLWGSVYPRTKTPPRANILGSNLPLQDGFSGIQYPRINSPRS